MIRVLMLAVLSSSGAANAVDWKESPYDDIAHVAGGTAISCAVTAATKKPLYGFLTSIAVGVIKESTDQNFDGKDLAGWGVGGSVGMLCIKF